jgi:hypothetical protein
MVSTKLKAKYSLEKTKRAGITLLPIFKKDSVADFTNEILREDEDLRRRVMANPDYRMLLEKKVAEVFKEYKGVLRGARLVDSWDRVTSAIGMVGDALGPFTGGIGYAVSAAEEIPELIPKAIYAVYYKNKTKDKKAIPYWSALEAASFIPYIGDAIDMSNIYVNRARKATKEKVKTEMKKILPSKLELKVA